MRYSEISRDLSSDGMKYIELGDEYIYVRNLREESPGEMSTQSGPLLRTNSSNSSYQQFHRHESSPVTSYDDEPDYDNVTRTTKQPNFNSNSNDNHSCKRHSAAKRHSCGNAHNPDARGYDGVGNGTAATIPYHLSQRQRKDSTKSTQSCQLDMVEHLQEMQTVAAAASKSITVKQNNRRKSSIGCLNTLSSSPDSPGCYYCVGTPPNGKTQSLPPQSSIKNFDAIVMSALRLPADELANQITLLDLPIFAAIQPDELTSCAWTKKDKHQTTPNIVAFTKRFNHTIFWTVQEILSAEQPKQRAEILTHFIRVAKKLHELNNLHSLFAIISAMQSASIFRLKKTWSNISKKDRQSYERLSDIFSDQNNWENLRSYLESLRLPCIPYLGLFLTDLIYIDLAHPHKGGLEPEQRRNKMNNILRVIANYQQSDYSQIRPIETTQKYLTSIRYIEELQNIFEEDQYKKSLKLEPASPSAPSSSSCSSKESFNVDAVTPALACLNLSPAKTLGSLRISSANKFIPGHRKCRSLGTNIFGKIVHTNNDINGQYISTTTNRTSNALHTDDYRHNHSDFLNQLQQSRHLLDDSVLEQNHHLQRGGTTNGTNETLLRGDAGGGGGDCISNDSIEGAAILYGGGGMVGGGYNNHYHGDNNLNMLYNCNTPMEHCIQGCVRRKTLQKDGRKPTVASWQRYWMQIWANTLVYFPPKSFKGSERSDFKREPCKVCPLDGWCAQFSSSNPKHKNSFELFHPRIGTIYKFRTDSPQATHMWIHSICKITAQRNSPKPLPVNLMSFE